MKDKTVNALNGLIDIVIQARDKVSQSKTDEEIAVTMLEMNVKLAVAAENIDIS